MNRLGRRPSTIVPIMRGFSIKLQKEELRSRSDRQVVPGFPPISPVREAGQFQGPTRWQRWSWQRLLRTVDEKTLAWRVHTAAPPLRVTSM
jgi:hypothetical protein